MTTALEGVSVTPRPLFTPEKDLVPIVQEAVWVPGPVWTGAENLAPTGIQSPDRPARSQSLYRLSYPAHNNKILKQQLTAKIFFFERKRLYCYLRYYTGIRRKELRKNHKIFQSEYQCNGLDSNTGNFVYRSASANLLSPMCHSPMQLITPSNHATDP